MTRYENGTRIETTHLSYIGVQVSVTSYEVRDLSVNVTFGGWVVSGVSHAFAALASLATKVSGVCSLLRTESHL